MKIYTKIVLDMTKDDLPVIEEEAWDYSGPIALCDEVGEFAEDTVDWFSDDLFNEPGAGGALPYIAGGVLGGAGGALLPGLLDMFSGDSETQERADELISEGVDRATAEQRAALERALNFLNPAREAGERALPQLENLAGLYGGTAEGIHPLLAREAMAEGLSPLGQFQLDTAHESIDKSLGGMGQYESGLRSELYKDAAVEISARDSAEKWNKRLQMMGLGQSQLAGLVDAGMGMSSQSAGLTVGTGANIGMTQLAGTLGQANIEAQQPGGLFGPHSRDLYQLAQLGIGLAGVL